MEKKIIHRRSNKWIGNQASFWHIPILLTEILRILEDLIIVLRRKEK